MNYFSEEQAEAEAARLNEEEQNAFKKRAKGALERYFDGRLGPDEVLMEASHLSHGFKFDDSWPIHGILGYMDYVTVSYYEKKIDYYEVKSSSETHTYTSGYSGTIGSDGNVSLSPNTYSSETTTYGVVSRRAPAYMYGEFKIVKKKDVDEVRRLETEVWKHKSEYDDVYGGETIADWRGVSKTVFFFKYGLVPLLQILMLALAALLLPKFYLSFSGPMGEMLAKELVLAEGLDDSFTFTLSPWIGVAVGGVALLSAIVLYARRKAADHWCFYSKYMGWYNTFFVCIVAAACCTAVWFLLGMIIVTNNLGDALFEYAIKPLFIVSFVLLTVSLGTLVYSGFGFIASARINKRLREIQLYVRSGRYKEDVQQFEMIKRFTIKTTRMGFSMPRTGIDLVSTD